MIKNILFDLDGTILNCEKLQVSILQQLFDNHKVSKDNIDFTTLIGPPLINTFAKYFGECNCQNVMQEYENIYQNIKIHNVILMPEMKSILQTLKKKGYHLFVTSLQIKDVVIKELKYVGVYDYFDKVVTDNPDFPYKNKPDLISDLIKEQKLDISETVVIGDTKNDLLGGEQNGLQTITVTWGYGKDCVKNQKYIAKNANELIRIIDELNK